MKKQIMAEKIIKVKRFYYFMIISWIILVFSSFFYFFYFFKSFECVSDEFYIDSYKMFYQAVKRDEHTLDYRDC